MTAALALLLAVTAMAQTPMSSEQLRRKQAEIQQEIDELKNTLNSSRKNTKAGLAELEMVKRKLRLREEAIENTSQQINLIEGNITSSKSEIDSLKAGLDSLKKQYAQSIVHTYQSRNNYDFLSFIFSAATFNEALRRIEYLRAYRTYHEQQAIAIRNKQQLLLQKIHGLQATRNEKDEALQKQEKQKTELEDEKKEKNSVVNELKAHEKEIVKELADRQKANRELGLAITKAIEREITLANKAIAESEKKAAVVAAHKAVKVSAKNSDIRKKPVKTSALEATPEGLRVSGSFARNKGHLPWPVEKGIIKSHFGLHKVEGVRGIIENNPGLTIGTEPGAVVESVFEGLVTSVFAIEDNWNVMVQHGKYFTVYSNLATVYVGKGQKIMAGEHLGKAANDTQGAGEITFIVMLERKNLDPEKWIRKL